MSKDHAHFQRICIAVQQKLFTISGQFLETRIGIEMVKGKRQYANAVQKN